MPLKFHPAALRAIWVDTPCDVGKQQAIARTTLLRLSRALFCPALTRAAALKPGKQLAPILIELRDAGVNSVSTYQASPCGYVPLTAVLNVAFGSQLSL
jgi:hypothetical protein